MVSAAFAAAASSFYAEDIAGCYERVVSLLHLDAVAAECCTSCGELCCVAADGVLSANLRVTIEQED